jgi:hypothetical protein
MKAKQTDTKVAVEQAQLWADELHEIAELISERFSRSEARERALSYLRDQVHPHRSQVSPLSLTSAIHRRMARRPDSTVCFSYSKTKLS